MVKTDKPQKTEAERRRERLAAELRANLSRRKNQVRARRSGEEDGRDGQLASGSDDDAPPPSDEGGRA